MQVMQENETFNEGGATMSQKQQVPDAFVIFSAAFLFFGSLGALVKYFQLLQGLLERFRTEPKKQSQSLELDLDTIVVQQGDLVTTLDHVRPPSMQLLLLSALLGIDLEIREDPSDS